MKFVFRTPARNWIKCAAAGNIVPLEFLREWSATVDMFEQLLFPK